MRTSDITHVDLPETHRGGSEDNGRYRTEEVNVSSEQAIMTGGTQRNKIKIKYSKSINYMLWCKQFFECRVATNTSVNS